MENGKLKRKDERPATIADNRRLKIKDRRRKKIKKIEASGYARFFFFIVMYYGSPDYLSALFMARVSRKKLSETAFTLCMMFSCSASISPFSRTT